MADDKKKHLLAGFIIALVAFTAASYLAIPAPHVIAFSMAVIAGAAKEIRDAFGYGHVEALDLICTAAGGIPFLIWGFYG